MLQNRSSWLLLAYFIQKDAGKRLGKVKKKLEGKKIGEERGWGMLKRLEDGGS